MIYIRMYLQVTAEKSADAPGDWSTVKLTVGVTRDKLRTLVIQFYADSRVSGLAYLSYSPPHTLFRCAACTHICSLNLRGKLFNGLKIAYTRPSAPVLART